MEITQKILDFVMKQEEPVIILDLDIIEKNYWRMKNSLDHSVIYYAVKANSEKRILERLVKIGSSFDIASIGELDLMLSLGADPSKLSYGNTIKKEKHIKYAYDKGVRLFVADEFSEIEKISRQAPGSKVFARIQMGDSDSDWPLTRKFGTNIEKAVDLMILAKEKDLIPYGISFHVGSQCYDKYAWKTALLKVADIFYHLKKEGIELKFINTGGGMPVQYLREIPEIEDITAIINETIIENFEGFDELIVATEPGRTLVGDAGLLCANVILRAEKEKNDWVYLDAGVFHGLMETIQNFRYEVIVWGKNGEEDNFTLAGPTCDSVDVIYDEVYLPNDVNIDDKVFFMNAGSYTTGYSTTFNGIESPKVYYTDEI
ncbi:MAG: type III PLP-dependent enzyme [Fusobacteria bacterium]|nr:type III PLP-dependent enzyme [Fusobacteriota bacterium]